MIKAKSVSREFLPDEELVPSISTSSSDTPLEPLVLLDKDAPTAPITGITAGGVSFVVPETHDMVRTLFDPTLRKTVLDAAIVVALLSNFAIYYLLPPAYRISAFIAIYVFWRFGYNLGIGYLLYHQSRESRMVKWAQRWQLFARAAGPASSRTRVQRIMEQEFSAKGIASASYPIEFNTWLIYRKFVDLILMQDFTAYMCLVVACSALNPAVARIVELPVLTAIRWSLGMAFILFNLWVKLDAHRIIKDFAWYWGDFFFLQKADLVFDGVFDMVPHPMYSVGYIGYYGFALLTKSYTVLIVSLFAHCLQFAFLIGVENPHIEKIYGSDDSTGQGDQVLLEKLHLKPLIFGLRNFNWFRSSDILSVLVWASSLVVPFLLPRTATARYTVFGATLLVKLVQSVGLNVILHQQSTTKAWTKRFLKHDYTLYNAFENWTVLYNAISSLTYTALAAFSARELLFHDTSDSLVRSSNSWPLLRYILGAMMVALQLWTQYSIFEEIGYFGWFYGDFFLPKLSSISKSGIYRYLNNPERFFGISGVWGLALATYSPLVFLLACVWTINNVVLLNFVEQPHMIKLYGEQSVLLDGGLSRTIKNLIPDQLKTEGFSPSRRLSMNNVSSLTGKLLRDLRRSKFQDSTDQKHLISLSEKIMDLSCNHSVQGYKVDFAVDSINTKRYVLLGEPIRVKWTAPETHSTDDWIGLYKVVNTGFSRKATKISSKGHWIGVSQTSEYYVTGSELTTDASKTARRECVLQDNTTSGTVEFKGDLLVLEAGIYEVRYHLGNHHNVGYISCPFEIRVAAIDIPATVSAEFTAALQGLLELVAPATDYTEAFKGKNGKKLQQFTYLIGTSTGIEIGETVVLNAKTVTGLGKKLIEIKGVLDELSK
ncbi:hypothetical protein BABINDRAFT_163382 [Babjeviella inositovora NRRL Y-12698]|uniref:Phosphatidylethanolamine N-methyltransferase n=1 Tax=Babjeviella inositovora NRRL Y-12698 TaxID=984486 RepID=A0A1E3QJ83_9ASCO|nr:uncharacterized protein BABINDRAFT_163382 [Babjeviella inositovora NRRL Y-12698]ODQ77668.1 hypothetical protein BABINDRAFT_163382 [Babjeviella inositovora NRRL Y-12698]